jgi:hypothetical protein
MNTVNATGWIQKDAWTATVPATYARIVCFDLFLVNHYHPAAPAVPWRCEISDLKLQAEAGPKLVAGAGLMIRGELEAVPFIKAGVVSGYTRTIQIDRVEFSRLPVSVNQPAQETAEATA